MCLRRCGLVRTRGGPDPNWSGYLEGHKQLGLGGGGLGGLEDLAGGTAAVTTSPAPPCSHLATSRVTPSSSQPGVQRDWGAMAVGVARHPALHGHLRQGHAPTSGVLDAVWRCEEASRLQKALLQGAEGCHSINLQNPR